MTRALIAIPDAAIHKLDLIAKRRHLSRSALIRSAIEEWLARQATKKQHKAFGILKNRKAPEGVALQRKLRSEW